MDNTLNGPGDHPFLSPEEETEIEARAVLGHAEIAMDQLLEHFERMVDLQNVRPQDVSPEAIEALDEQLQAHLDWMKPYGIIPDDKAPGGS
ncbi:hypothetical protein LVY72_02945 [Arthrobacter sp. I2-34]|uniref:Uncharacterized protein n=1 Tax=Arthrobacter hankyongi TaxID=2904801 RepID=A0ABS9L2R3_9MICC|nr:hypothetical protein [Arthrobacter hankyongi]MCG2620868.1 hypothetical protein [Arthrobacter hankyongi]